MTDEEKLFTVLSELVLTAGVSGDEGRVADVVARHLQASGFTGAEIQSDYIGNRWVHLGPPGEPQRLLVAHMDEIGQRIASIRPDGYCTLQPIGGSDPQLWEGTPVDVHTQGGPVTGCIAPVSHHVTFSQGLAAKERLAQHELLLDVGANSPEEVAALGIQLLDPVTWPKTIALCANDMVQARSLDDRFGCCALLFAAAQLKEQPPSVPTVIAWSAQEEVSLRGARVLAHRFSKCSEVIAIDSFCTGAGPHDSKQWASAVLGCGPVLRSWDLTTLVPDAVRQELLHMASVLGVDLQYGYMAGGNDASQFEFCGACVFGLSVCVQYSHTNAERINLQDLAQLTRLIVAWCGTELQ
jgi:putative aminopeptidase FrvX